MDEFVLVCCFFVHVFVVTLRCVFYSVFPVNVGCRWCQTHVDSRSRSDGWQTEQRKTWLSGRVRAEKVLAEAVTIEGRKEWICKFCSETNVWTRWRCRRCCANLPAGLQGKYRQVPHPRVVENSETRMLKSENCERKLKSFCGSKKVEKEAGSARRTCKERKRS